MKQIVWFAFALALLCSVIIRAEDRPFTADSHKKVDVTCAGCHKEEQPKAAATQESCITCHKSLEAVAEKTKDFDRNPHRNHLTESTDVECTQCHQGHKADVVLCHQCHSGMTFEKVTQKNAEDAE